MKIAIIGAGAIGGLVGAKLALAGEQVTFIARGAHLQAIRAHGMTLEMADGSRQHAGSVGASDDHGAVGPQDLVILATKAHQVEAAAAHLPKLYGPETVVVTMQNGIPFWYFHRHGGALAGSRIASVDPRGEIGRLIPPERVLGCVLYPAAALAAPGVVRHIEGNRMPLGELDGSHSPRVQRIAATFERAGFQAPVLDDIRAEIWLKLWGNLTFNPISALSRATMIDICRDAPTRALAATMMTEAQAVAARLGITFRVTVEQRIAGAERIGKHKTSMLQDVEAGREIEVDALIGAVVELARLTQTPTPTIDAVHALTRLLARVLRREV